MSAASVEWLIMNSAYFNAQYLREEMSGMSIGMGPVSFRDALPFRGGDGHINTYFENLIGLLKFRELGFLQK